ncbi:hypothetical protein II906_12830 [bacterium]|nr:hypothetical protein [bacterium]
MSGNWEKLTDNIYIEKDSIKKYKYTISGWFKMYSSEDTALYYDNTEYYSLIQYEADCVSPALCLLHIKEFDKNDILLLDEPNEHNVCYNGPGGWIHGEVAYKALCKFWK